MRDLRRALAEIEAIRDQVARATQFRGYGPLTVAATGGLAAAAAAAQAALLRDPAAESAAYLGLWAGTAAVSLALIALETIFRARRAHAALSAPMLQSAGEEFLPAILAGSLLTLVIARDCPSNLWMLPGLWQVIFSLGVFSSCRRLPRPMLAVGLWYLCSGLILLARGNGAYALSPWSMGVPFGVGQILVAAILRFGYRQAHEIP
jgi:hypothetical protein